MAETQPEKQPLLSGKPMGPSKWPINSSSNALADAKQACDERAKASLEVAKKILPGGTVLAYVTMPLRILVFLIFFSIFFPLFMMIGFFRALYIKARFGPPSKALELCTRCNDHDSSLMYPCMQLYDAPFDEDRLRKAFVELCAEDGITEEDLALVFEGEEPQDWPENGSYDINYWIPTKDGSREKLNNFWEWLDTQPKKIVRIHVWNGQPGKPTVMFFGGSGNRWDGSANYNFNRELQNRYMGGEPLKPTFPQAGNLGTITVAAAEKADQLSFCYFMTKMPYHIFWNVAGTFWNVVRAFGCFGGNGFGFKMTAMNFTDEESKALYNGAKALGASPFAAFCYASNKACKDVLGQAPYCITQQASLQTRHFPVDGQGDKRNFVGDWLVGPLQYPSLEYDLKEAQQGYQDLRKDLDEFGPATQYSFMAKAYGLLNSGAAGFELMPSYNDDMHVMDRCIFMNNYGVRDMPNPNFVAWNWNAPLWFGLNTINVNGRTTTLVGSCMQGLPVVQAMRDNIESTLREIMSKAPEPDTM